MSRVDHDRPLRQAFRFQAADLAANREGRLSQRQAALLRAGRAGMRLAFGVFAAVMLGTVGFAAFVTTRLGTPGEWDRGAGAATAVVVVLIGIGYLTSRRYMATARSRRVSVATGAVAILSDASDECRVRIGGTPLRLPDAAALQAFQPGVEYSVYYPAGPVAVVLSAEALAAGIPSLSGPADADAEEHAAATAQVAVGRRGYVVVLLLGLLALGIPFAGVLVGDLPSRLRAIGWVSLLAVTVGFAWLAVWWLTARDHRAQ
jgi:hypothetical protein